MALCQLLGVYEQVAHGTQRKVMRSKCLKICPKPTLPRSQQNGAALRYEEPEQSRCQSHRRGEERRAEASFASSAASSRALHLSGGNADRLGGGKSLPETDSPAPNEVDLRTFYEAFPYPPEERNLDHFADGSQVVEGSPRHWFPLYFPDRPYTEDIDVLVAGCGTCQAARLSVLNPHTRITAIDISRVALEKTQQLKRQYNLKLLDLVELPVEEVSRLGRDFDLIYCTGVLHHLADPVEGLRALRSTLKPDGRLDLMLYGRHGRATTLVIQELMRRLSIRATGEGAAKALRWSRALPPDHPFWNATVPIKDLESHEGIADLLLNPRERSYSVDDIYNLLRQADLRLQRFFYQAYYSPRCALPTDSPLLAQLEKLPPEDQYAVIELFRSSIRKHQFVACRDDRPESAYRPEFSGSEFVRYVPVFTPGIKIVKEDYPNGGKGKIHYPLHKIGNPSFVLDASQLALLEAVNGRRSVASIVGKVAGKKNAKSREERAGRFFQTMWERDFLLFYMPPEDNIATAGSPKPQEVRPQGAIESPAGPSKRRISADGSRILYESCPLCAEEEIKLFREADCTTHPHYREGLPRTIRWVQCAGCEHIFTEGYFTEEVQGQVLEIAHAHQMPAPGKELETARHVAARIVSSLGSVRGRLGGRWLDVGFGNGALLATAAEFGHDAMGIDVRPAVVTAMRSLGYPARCVEFTDFHDEEGFDVISMADVLEHMPFPRQALRHADELLKPGGAVFISMPNMDCLIWKLMDRHESNPYWAELEHCHNFTRERLYRLLREVRFDPCHYAVNARYLAGMEVIARKPGEAVSPPATAVVRPPA